MNGERGAERLEPVTFGNQIAAGMGYTFADLRGTERPGKWKPIQSYSET